MTRRYMEALIRSSELVPFSNEFVTNSTHGTIGDYWVYTQLPYAASGQMNDAVDSHRRSVGQWVCMTAHQLLT